MKIALVTGSYPPHPCGIGDHAERLQRALMDAGIEVGVVTTMCAERPPNEAIVHELENWRLRNWRRAVDWLASQSYDLVHIQYPGKYYGYRPDLAFLTSVLKKRIPGLPLVITVHEFRITHVLRKFSVAAVVTPVDAIILTTESERKIYEKAVPWVRSKIQVVNIAAVIPTLETSTEERARLRARYSVRPQELVIAHFGFMQPNKGVESLLEAFRIVHEQRPETKLMMMCLFEPDTNPYHAQLRQQMHSLRINDAVIWTGFLSPEEVSHHLAIADLAAYPYQDGVSLRRSSFMTALCHGVPAVTTLGHTLVEELGLVEGEHVLLVPARKPWPDPTLVAGALLRLIDSEDLRSRLSAAGPVWTRPMQWDSVAKQTIEVYGSVVRSSPRT